MCIGKTYKLTLFPLYNVMLIQIQYSRLTFSYDLTIGLISHLAYFSKFSSSWSLLLSLTLIFAVAVVLWSVIVSNWVVYIPNYFLFKFEGAIPPSMNRLLILFYQQSSLSPVKRYNTHSNITIYPKLAYVTI